MLHLIMGLEAYPFFSLEVNPNAFLFQVLRVYWHNADLRQLMIPEDFTLLVISPKIPKLLLLELANRLFMAIIYFVLRMKHNTLDVVR